eukprot:6483982-Pyramimonas_sp.AAC.1
MATAKRVKAAAVSPPGAQPGLGGAAAASHPVPGPLTGSLVGLLGPDASAGAVARALTAGAAPVDMDAKLKA